MFAADLSFSSYIWLQQNMKYIFQLSQAYQLNTFHMWRMLILACPCSYSTTVIENFMESLRLLALAKWILTLMAGPLMVQRKHYILHRYHMKFSCTLGETTFTRLSNYHLFCNVLLMFQFLQCLRPPPPPNLSLELQCPPFCNPKWQISSIRYKQKKKKNQKKW